MSRIDELIQRLCTDGVEYAKIGALAQVGTGSSDRKDAVCDGNYPFYVRSKDVMRIDSYEFDEEALLIPGEGGIGEIFHYVNGKYALHQRAYRIHFTDARVHPRFAYFYFSAKFKRFILQKAVSATVTSIRKPMITDFPFPMPPLEVQREIVRVLDKFTQLEAELDAELEARRAQYEYYRTEFLTFGDNVPRRPLREIATIGTGSHDTKDATPDGEFIFYARGREPLRLDSYDFDERAIITAGDGVGVGKVFHFADGKYALHQRAYRVVPGEQVDPRFIYHYLVSDFSRYLERTSVHASVTSLRRPMFLKYPVPVPPRAEQERIVATLDKLDALVNDISIGLPAELNARRKQYEYYRDRVLTFDEVI